MQVLDSLDMQVLDREWCGAKLIKYYNITVLQYYSITIF